MPAKMAVPMNAETSATERPTSFAKTAPMPFSDEFDIPAQTIPITPTGEMAKSSRNFIRCGELGFGALALVSKIGTRAKE